MAVQTERARDARNVAIQHPAVRRAAVFGDHLHVTVSSMARDWPSIDATLRQAGIVVTGAERIVPSLEDVFIDRIAAARAS